VKIYTLNTNCIHTSIIIVTIFFGFVLFAGLVTDNVYAQQKNSSKIQQQTPLSSSTSSSPLSVTNLHAVKITSPTKGQQVPIGKNLTISGTSLGNATSHCQVSVIGNGIKPYQPATAAGPSGATDYSKWNFVLSPKYTTIKEGPNNKITAKYSCSNNPSALSYYSVNVTGIAVGAAASLPLANNSNTQKLTNITMQQQQQQQAHQPKTEVNGTSVTTTTPTAISHSINGTMTAAKDIRNTSNNNASSLGKIKENTNTNKTVISGSNNIASKLKQSSTSPSSTPSNSNNKPLSVSIHSSQTNINGRGTSSITAIAYDAATGKKVNNAVVKLKIVFNSNGTTKEIKGNNGEATYSVNMKPNSNNNIDFSVTTQASAPGYIPTSKTSSSMSSSSSSSTTTSNNNNNNQQQSIITNYNNNSRNNNNNINFRNYLHDKIIQDVQKRLKDKGIDISP
jgi:hypothetical protein